MAKLTGFSVTALMLLVSVATAATAYRSADGNLYLIRDSAAGPSWEKLTIVDMPGVDPSDPQPDDPTPNEDRWGLSEVSRNAAAEVSDYDGKDDHQLKLAAYYEGVADAVEAGSITNDRLPDGRTQVAVALDVAFTSAVSGRADEWATWKETTTKALNAAPLNSAADSAQALRDVAGGLEADEMTQQQAIDRRELLKFFVEVILPLILRFIGAGASN